MWNFSAEANNFICVAILMPRMTNVVNISRGGYSQVCKQAPHDSSSETCVDQSGRSGGSRYWNMNIHAHGS